MNLHTNLDLTRISQPPFGNLYPKCGNPGKRVEIPVATVRKSLPKMRKNREKGRESHSRRPEISTQKAKTGKKGRETQSRRPEISTQKAENGRKGRDSQFTRPEISTQKAEKPKIGREPPVRTVFHPTTGSAVSHLSSPSFASPQISTQKAENPTCPNIKNYAN